MARIAHLLTVTALLAVTAAARAQDVQGIEACTHETRMDRRTGCLQSNIEYLHELVRKNAASAQQKLAAAEAEIAALDKQVAALRLVLTAVQGRLDAVEAAAKARPAGPDVKPAPKPAAKP